MSLFKHPYLPRGTIQTPFGEFLIHRGGVDAPDAIGERYGWLRVLREEHADRGEHQAPTPGRPHLTRSDESSLDYR